ncbi:MAG: DUF4230 domain-containing protein [Lachnospiraceae bacterium]|nr:DUF4230 domain-containing protein [Lachnospiraceae bacterium]
MRRIQFGWMLAVILTVVSAGCGKQEPVQIPEPQIEQVRSICNLATVQCYYHNVAKSEKKAEKGITHLGEKDRKFWIEYTGIANLGIDVAEVQMNVDGTEVEVTLPEAKLLNISIDRETLNEASYISSADGLNKNEITADDQTEAIHLAQQKMEETVSSNTTLLLNAQNRAKKLIENYIVQLGEATGVEYHITWIYSETGKKEADTTDTEQTSDP